MLEKYSQYSRAPLCPARDYEIGCKVNDLFSIMQGFMERIFTDLFFFDSDSLDIFCFVFNNPPAVSDCMTLSELNRYG